MEFADVNWTVIAIATGLNMLIGYLFFESRLTKRWRSAVEIRAWKPRPRYRLYFTLLVFSILMALFAWFFFNEPTSFGFMSLGLLFLLFAALEIFHPSIGPMTIKNPAHTFRSSFFGLNLVLSMIIVMIFSN